MEMVHFIPAAQRRIAMMAAQADSTPVLISGASGTGKGSIARWIHSNSPRRGGPLLTADHDKPLVDQIHEAQGGSLIIPEIGEWNLGAQKMLLDYLTSHTIPHPIGNGTPMIVHTRIIATSSQSLEGRAQSALFNLELLQKLNVFRLEMPDLSKRVDDFEDIVLGVFEEITRELHKEHLMEIAPDAFTKLAKYHWPGNIRELRNVLRLGVISARADKLQLGDLPADFDQSRVDYQATREEFEKIYILELLKTFNWQIDKTCQAGRINKSTLLNKMKKYGIDVTQHPSVP